MVKKLKLRMKGGGSGVFTGGAPQGGCPDGTFCFTSNMVFFALAVVIVGLLAYVIMTGQSSTPAFAVPPPAAALAQPAFALPHRSPPATVLNINAGGDSRYDRAPQPLRDWNAGPEWPPRGGIASIPINIPTQGLPERFQSVGIVTSPDGQVLPLYGRRTAGSTDRWNYYTRTDTYNPVPIPVSYKKRDCMDDVGCDELMNGEEIKNFGTGTDGKVHIYRMDGPKYIPGLI
jgi:hypothetical protein